MPPNLDPIKRLSMMVIPAPLCSDRAGMRAAVDKIAAAWARRRPDHFSCAPRVHTT